ncbi:uncharacterized protein LOC128092866 [Culex pipiens pallens]|uniref:uncharacterized protein LOC128092866 n=1 Tax=Culex pipiens pallens TaxID=42434 RepID=UPI0022AADC4C|nr:uncharacterized protein LOC128092866 [Culex pipiens pallens]
MWLDPKRATVPAIILILSAARDQQPHASASSARLNAHTTILLHRQSLKLGRALNRRGGSTRTQPTTIPNGLSRIYIYAVRVYPMVCSTSAKSSLKLINAASFGDSLVFACMKVVCRYPKLVEQANAVPGLRRLIDELWFLQFKEPKKTDEFQRNNLLLEDEALLCGMKKKKFNEIVSQSQPKAVTETQSESITEDQIYEGMLTEADVRKGKGAGGSGSSNCSSSSEDEELASITYVELQVQKRGQDRCCLSRWRAATFLPVFMAVLHTDGSSIVRVVRIF